MLKCPYCNFHNEDGALFCEQCKSDLASAVPVAAAAPAAHADSPVEAVPMAAVIEEEPIPLASVEPIAAVAVAEAPPAPPAAPAAAPAPMAEAAPAPAAPAAPAAEGPKLAADAKPKLVVIRGQKINAEYPIYEGLNFIGRADEKPVDIDLEDQEHPDKIWCSRQHACINFENGALMIEDLSSANGTYVNRTRVYAGQRRQLNVNDVIQIGNVQMKVKV
jgi:hypothetical protein